VVVDGVFSFFGDAFVVEEAVMLFNKLATTFGDIHIFTANAAFCLYGEVAWCFFGFSIVVQIGTANWAFFLAIGVNKVFKTRRMKDVPTR